MSGLDVRLAGLDDAPALADLRASWRAGLDVAATDAFRHAFSQWLESELSHRRFWIASRRGEDGSEHAVGMVNLLVFTRMPTEHEAAGAWGYLGNMFVRENERDHGVGAQLLHALLAYADASALVRVVLNPSERSRPFYARHGFAAADDGLLIRRRS